MFIVYVYIYLVHIFPHQHFPMHKVALRLLRLTQPLASLLCFSLENDRSLYSRTVSAPSQALWCCSWLLYCRRSALVVCGSVFPKPTDCQLTAEITFEGFSRTLQVAVCRLSLLPFPHLQAQTVLPNLRCCGD